ncbi:hypothetical protein PV08_00872 [Exophiala spinifera]|uniref:Cyclin-D1-binding protein 1-like N-terminal domain-containing protein n=1 Tax=Exophiala spinifera TaxID=91928 RepID=A0A0D2A678_9EURO|nr:uncharacterized protein PV08_00872 [Exophiala spinifera]KIW20297.1 hypothetical protein PV08_00872 [Exophiala spinifera]
MSVSNNGSLAAVLQTSISLCERFAASLAPNAAIDLPPTNPDSPSPLILADAAAASLKSQVTKLSLLAITTPFTASAITTCLKPLNESILTSLVTAALLTTAELFTASFSGECRSLAATTLLDTQGLLQLIATRSTEGKPKTELSGVRKKAFTEATGRIWDDCDKLVPLAKEGVPGYVVRKSKEWLDLMKDAVREFEEWDPAENIDDDDPFGEQLSDDDEEENLEEGSDTDRIAISAGVKEQALKVLNRIPQSIHVVIKQRLEKMDLSKQASRSQIKQLDTILKRSRHVSELIDESAEGMYLGDPEICLKKAGEARAVTIEVVESVLQPITQKQNAASNQSKEDKYIQRALEWIQQVDPANFAPSTLSGSHNRNP